MWPATQTRPDISVGVLCLYLTKSTSVHLDVAYRVAIYLRGTANHALCVGGSFRRLTSMIMMERGMLGPTRTTLKSI